jgi:nucleotide-binding universal stress UspA family protein
MVKLPLMETGERLQADLKRVLVAVDFSTESLAALQFATSLVGRSGGSLLMVNVVEPAFHPPEHEAGSHAANETEHQRLERAKQRLGSLGRGLFAQCRIVETAVRSGIAFFEIIEAAKALRADLIVIGARGFSGEPHSSLGCTVEQVVRHASMPVLVVR